MMTFCAGILWDMDGVLVDTGELHYKSWATTLAGYGYDLTFDLFKTTFGMNNYDILKTIYGHPPSPDFLAQVTDQKEGSFREMIHGRARPLPGVLDWLEQIKARGFAQAVASSAPIENVDVLVDELGLRPYFSALVSGYAMQGKPAPDIFLEAARQVGVLPSACLVIEDSIAGVQAAKRAGMTCIAVLTTNPASALSAADLITPTLAELDPAVIEDLLARK
jgi:beta-phosphoglucomutase family hydrolase